MYVYVCVCAVHTHIYTYTCTTCIYARVNAVLLTYDGESSLGSQFINFVVQCIFGLARYRMRLAPPFGRHGHLRPRFVAIDLGLLRSSGRTERQCRRWIAVRRTPQLIADVELRLVGRQTNFPHGI